MGTKLFPRGYLIVFWILTFHALDLYWNIIPGREIVPGAHVGFEARDVLGSHLFWGIFVFIGVGCLSIWSVIKSFRSGEAEIIQSVIRVYLTLLIIMSDPMQQRADGCSIFITVILVIAASVIFLSIHHFLSPEQESSASQIIDEQRKEKISHHAESKNFAKS